MICSTSFSPPSPYPPSHNNPTQSAFNSPSPPTSPMEPIFVSDNDSDDLLHHLTEIALTQLAESEYLLHNKSNLDAQHEEHIYIVRVLLAFAQQFTEIDLIFIYIILGTLFLAVVLFVAGYIVFTSNQPVTDKVFAQIVESEYYYQLHQYHKQYPSSPHLQQLNQPQQT